MGGKCRTIFLESLKLQRIDFFVKLVAASECDDEEKRLVIQWVSELTDELMAKIRTHEYNRQWLSPVRYRNVAGVRIGF
ncbi:levan regulatory domain protein [Cronobacter universalis]|nr:levan regulatory domain protein [Cronobacter universalis]